MPKIKLYCSSGFTGGGHEDFLEIEDAFWDALSEKEKDDYLDEAAIAHRDNHIECGAWVVDENDDPT